MEHVLNPRRLLLSRFLIPSQATFLLFYMGLMMLSL